MQIRVRNSFKETHDKLKQAGYSAFRLIPSGVGTIIDLQEPYSPIDLDIINHPIQFKNLPEGHTFVTGSEVRVKTSNTTCSTLGVLKFGVMLPRKGHNLHFNPEQYIQVPEVHIQL